MAYTTEKEIGIKAEASTGTGCYSKDTQEEVKTMQWEIVVALVVAIPVILFPVAYIWYLNVGGIYAAIKRVRERRAIRQQGKQAIAEHVTTHK